MQITDSDMKTIDGLLQLLVKLKEDSKSSDSSYSTAAKSYLGLLHERRISTSENFLKNLKGNQSLIPANDKNSLNTVSEKVNVKIDLSEGKINHGFSESNNNLVLSIINDPSFSKCIEKKIYYAIEKQKPILVNEMKKLLKDDEIKYQEKKQDIPIKKIADSQENLIDDLSSNKKEDKDEFEKEVILPDMEIKEFLATYATDDNDTYVRLGLTTEEQEKRSIGYYPDNGEEKVGKLEAKDGNATYYAAESKSHKGLYLMAPVKDLSWNHDAIDMHAIKVFFEIEKNDSMNTSFELLKPAILEKKADNYFYLIEKGMMNIKYDV